MFSTINSKPSNRFKIYICLCKIYNVSNLQIFSLGKYYKVIPLLVFRALIKCFTYNLSLSYVKGTFFLITLR